MSTSDRPRNSNTGKYVPDPRTALRDADACQLRAQGYTYQQIADELFGGNKGHAHEAVDRALKATVQQPAADVRRMELERLDVLYSEAMAVLRRQHVTVSNGRIVQLDGEPLADDAPVLQAIDRALRVMDRRAKLLGLDAPSRVSVDAEQLGAEILALLTGSSGDGQPDA